MAENLKFTKPLFSIDEWRRVELENKRAVQRAVVERLPNEKTITVTIYDGDDVALTGVGKICKTEYFFPARTKARELTDAFYEKVDEAGGEGWRITKILSGAGEQALDKRAEMEMDKFKRLAEQHADNTYRANTQEDLQRMRALAAELNGLIDKIHRDFVVPQTNGRDDEIIMPKLRDGKSVPPYFVAR